MNKQSVIDGLSKISAVMTENKEYLIKLDQQNGDGDLGVSMSEGFAAAAAFAAEAEETDLGKLMMQTGKVFNEAAPSSLGTIISFAFMGMAKSLKGKTEATLPEVAEAVMKTILDAIYPAAVCLKEHESESFGEALKAAAEIAAQGSENTKKMKSVHGRAAYYAEQSIGILDGGSVVGKLIFEALA